MAAPGALRERKNRRAARARAAYQVLRARACGDLINQDQLAWEAAVGQAGRAGAAAQPCRQGIPGARRRAALRRVGQAAPPERAPPPPHPPLQNRSSARGAPSPARGAPARFAETSKKCGPPASLVAGQVPPGRVGRRNRNGRPDGRRPPSPGRPRAGVHLAGAARARCVCTVLDGASTHGPPARALLPRWAAPHGQPSS